MLHVLWPTRDTENDPELRLLDFLRSFLNVKTLPYVSDIMLSTPLILLMKQLPSSFTHFCHLAIYFTMMKYFSFACCTNFFSPSVFQNVSFSIVHKIIEN